MPQLKYDEKGIMTSISWNSRESIEVLYGICTYLWAIRIAIMLGRAGVMKKRGSFSLIYFQLRKLTSLPENSGPGKGKIYRGTAVMLTIS